ncbi:MAG: hypothetical protein ACR2KX_09900 [Chitinophagaceae bacterium]
MSEGEKIEHQNAESETPKAESQSTHEADTENIASQQPVEQPGMAINTSDIPTSEINDMEVHHHPDIHHKPKKWKEYFLEFLMIFIAVTLGFFVENIREHLVENNKEKQYIGSIAEDIKQDISQLDTIIKQRKKKISNWIHFFISLIIPTLMIVVMKYITMPAGHHVLIAFTRTTELFSN